MLAQQQKLQMSIYSDLYDYCSLNQNDRVKEILDNSEYSINILHKKGAYFDFAIAKNNIEMLKTLLKYAEETKVESWKIAEVLTGAVENFGASEEVQEVFNRVLGIQEQNSYSKDHKMVFSAPYSLNTYDELSTLTKNNLQKLRTQSSQEKLQVISGLFIDEYNNMQVTSDERGELIGDNSTTDYLDLH